MELLLPTPPSLPCSILCSPTSPDGTSSHPPLSSAHPSHPSRWRVFPPSESDLDTLPFTEILPQGKYVQELCWIIISTSPQPWPHHPSPSKRHQLASPAQCAPPLLHPLNPPRADWQNELLSISLNFNLRRHQLACPLPCLPVLPSIAKGAG